MARPQAPAPSLEDQLDRAVVAPLFARLGPAAAEDASLPPLVAERRRRRARGRLLDALASRGTPEVPPPLRREIEALVQSWAEAAFRDGFAPVEQFEIRCAREREVTEARDSGNRERLLAALEQDYRRKIVEQFGRIELQGVQTSHRVLHQLEEVYVPLHLEHIVQEHEWQAGEGKVLIPEWLPKLPVQKVLAENRHLLIVGAPGSGKSTLVAHLALRAAGGRLTGELGWDKDLLPLVLTVRSVQGALDLSAPALARMTGCDPGLVGDATERQRVFLLVDGVDEAPDEQRRALIAAIQGVLATNPWIRLIATSRPAGAPGQIEKQLDGLKPFRLAELTRDEVDEFIDRWCLGAERSVRTDVEAAEREARKAATDLKERLSRSYAVQRIAANPLIVTILCTVHRFFGRSIPEHRVTLYEKCTDALLYEWDQAKFPEGAAIGRLDALAKRRLLMGVARQVHGAHAAEISEHGAVSEFARILPDLGHPAAEAKRLVAEIRDRSGLLVERRPGFFAFSHLTFQEYFCAREHVRLKKLGELTDFYRDPWWHEVIVLAAGIPGGGGGTIPRRLLRRRSATATFLAAQCLETEVDMPLQVRERIEDALRAFVPPKDFDAAFLLERLGPVTAPILARSLASGDEFSKIMCLAALEDLDYDPAIPAIARCASGPHQPEVDLKINGTPLSVAGYATYILLNKAKRGSIMAKTAAEHALELISDSDFKALETLRAVSGLSLAIRRDRAPASVAGSTA